MKECKHEQQRRRDMFLAAPRSKRNITLLLQKMNDIDQRPSSCCAASNPPSLLMSCCKTSRCPLSSPAELARAPSDIAWLQSEEGNTSHSSRSRNAHSGNGSCPLSGGSPLFRSNSLSLCCGRHTPSHCPPLRDIESYRMISR